MVLSVDQLAQLRTANPFLSEDDYIYADRYISENTGLTTAQTFAKLLENTTTSLGVLQYALEEPDEVLLVGRPFRSGAIAPAANVPTILETATTSSKLVNTVIVTNYLGAAQGCALYHVVNGVVSVPFDADAILYLPPPAIPNGTTPIRLNVLLRPGDQLRATAFSGSCAFVAYIQV